ncbi:MAG: hypothetical protein QME96_04205, partial [Myxococcota bacterium]|nr:hypothetical protein [Myxococcota bacterium]
MTTRNPAGATPLPICHRGAALRRRPLLEALHSLPEIGDLRPVGNASAEELEHRLHCLPNSREFRGDADLALGQRASEVRPDRINSFQDLGAERIDTQVGLVDTQVGLVDTRG